MPEFSFAAIDFETADESRDSACAVAVVRAHGSSVIEESVQLLRPPRPDFLFTRIHGITWSMVAQKPSFAQYWPELERKISGVNFLAAHNAAFDRSVLETCCRSVGAPIPKCRFVCTVSLARQTWGIYPTKLPDVCQRLGIDLKHHDPLSDARACAQIVIKSGLN
ncbi:MAG: 3'-5' exonuclease [Elusimicrobiota bacterium]